MENMLVEWSAFTVIAGPKEIILYTGDGDFSSMALDGVPRNRGSPKTVEQLLHSDNPTAWNASSGFGRIHDQEEYHPHHSKKLSVLAKVKENARKWRQIVLRKKHGHGMNHTPSWGVALEDYEVNEDTDSHGAPTHQSRNVSKSSRDNDKHDNSNITYVHPDNLESNSLRRRNKTGAVLGKSHSNHEGGTSSIPRVTIEETLRTRTFQHCDRENRPSPDPKEITFEALVTRKNVDNEPKEKPLCSDMTMEPLPAVTNSVEYKVEYPTDSRKMIDSAQEINSGDQEADKSAHSPKKTLEMKGGQTGDNVMVHREELEKKSPTKMKAIITETISEATSKLQGLSNTSPQGNGEEAWDKGVSVTEYLKQKLEPGEDERALSQVISEVISPRRSPSEKGVVEKMKTAATLLFQNEEPSTFSSLKASDSSSHIPVSTNAHEVEEENQGRVLQAN